MAGMLRRMSELSDRLLVGSRPGQGNLNSTPMGAPGQDAGKVHAEPRLAWLGSASFRRAPRALDAY